MGRSSTTELCVHCVLQSATLLLDSNKSVQASGSSIARRTRSKTKNSQNAEAVGASNGTASGMPDLGGASSVPYCHVRSKKKGRGSSHPESPSHGARMKNSSGNDVSALDNSFVPHYHVRSKKTRGKQSISTSRGPLMKNTSGNGVTDLDDSFVPHYHVRTKKRKRYQSKSTSRGSRVKDASGSKVEESVFKEIDEAQFWSAIKTTKMEEVNEGSKVEESVFKEIDEAQFWSAIKTTKMEEVNEGSKVEESVFKEIDEAQFWSAIKTTKMEEVNEGSEVEESVFKEIDEGQFLSAIKTTKMEEVNEGGEVEESVLKEIDEAHCSSAIKTTKMEEVNEGNEVEESVLKEIHEAQVLSATKTTQMEEVNEGKKVEESVKEIDEAHLLSVKITTKMEKLNEGNTDEDVDSEEFLEIDEAGSHFEHHMASSTRQELNERCTPVTDVHSDVLSDSSSFTESDDTFEGHHYNSDNTSSLDVTSSQDCFADQYNVEGYCDHVASIRYEVHARKVLNSISLGKENVEGEKSEQVKAHVEDYEMHTKFDDDAIKRERAKEKDTGEGTNKSCFGVKKVAELESGNQAQIGEDVDRHDDSVPIEVDVDSHKKKKPVYSKPHDLCRILAHSILEGEPMVENKKCDDKAPETPACEAQNTLPLKFRFEDEVPRQVEKTEYEEEIDELWSEFYVGYALANLSNPEIVQEQEDNPADETLNGRCARGDHEFVTTDDKGCICVNCLHVAVEPKDIMPQLIENTCPESRRWRSSNLEDHSDFYEVHLASLTHNNAAFIYTGDGTVWDLKPGVRKKLYKHQQEGFEFVWTNLAGSLNLAELKNLDTNEVGGGCIISHAPGTGKSLLTIVFLETYLKLFPKCRPMIIAPVGMLLTWEEELRKWKVDFPFHNLNNLQVKVDERTPKLLTGSKTQGKDIQRMLKICSWNKGGSILGISYNLFEQLTSEKYTKHANSKKKKTAIADEKNEYLRKILLEKPGLVVMDEGHTPRNDKSNIYNAIYKLKAKRRIILSGTPFQNNFQELFNTLRLVRPASADSLAQDKAISEVIAARGRKHKGDSEEVIDSSVIEKLKLAISPFVNVHKGTILQESLPGLRECVISLKPQAALQKRLIDNMAGNQRTLESEFSVGLLSTHPYLLKYCDSSERQKNGEELDAAEASKLDFNEGAKTKFVLELVRLSMILDEKVLVFSQYIQPLELIKEQIRETFNWVDGREILRLEGKLEQKQRQVLINKFNNPESEAKVMLASTRCCSEGISLIGASRVVLLDVVWNFSVVRQAICRAYRIGQSKVVNAYHLMTCGTNEGYKYRRQAMKGLLSELVFCSSSNETEHHAPVIEDSILEEMLRDPKLKEMFDKINKPTDIDFI